MMPRLMPCNSSPAAGGSTSTKHIDHLGDRRFGLTGADRLDQHRVEPGGLADQDRLARAARHPAGLGARPRTAG